MKKLTLILILAIICNFLIAETQKELRFQNHEIIKNQEAKGILKSDIQESKDDSFEQNYYVYKTSYFNEDIKLTAEKSSKRNNEDFFIKR